MFNKLSLEISGCDTTREELTRLIPELRTQCEVSDEEAQKVEELQAKVEECKANMTSCVTLADKLEGELSKLQKEETETTTMTTPLVPVSNGSSNPLDLGEGVVSATSTPAPPGVSDIILGRGQRGRNHPGNQLLKRVLEDRYREWEAAGKFQKATIVREIFEDLSQGGRFLTPATPVSERMGDNVISEWAEVDAKAAQDQTRLIANRAASAPYCTKASSWSCTS